MAVQTLYRVPPKAVLPLVKGEDVDVDFVYKPALLNAQGELLLDTNGNAQYVEEDFPDGVSLILVIEPKVIEEAVIVGSRAKINIDHAIVDRVRPGALWRLVLRLDELERVLLNGTTIRSDGA
jgi:hypothetical protein